MACYFTIDTKSTHTATQTVDFTYTGGSAYTYVPLEQRAQLATPSPYFPNWWRDDDIGSALVPA